MDAGAGDAPPPAVGVPVIGRPRSGSGLSRNGSGTLSVESPSSDGMSSPRHRTPSRTRMFGEEDGVGGGSLSDLSSGEGGGTLHFHAPPNLTPQRPKTKHKRKVSSHTIPVPTGGFVVALPTSPEEGQAVAHVGGAGGGGVAPMEQVEPVIRIGLFTFVPVEFNKETCMAIIFVQAITMLMLAGIFLSESRTARFTIIPFVPALTALASVWEKTRQRRHAIVHFAASVMVLVFTVVLSVVMPWSRLFTSVLLLTMALSVEVLFVLISFKYVSQVDYPSLPGRDGSIENLRIACAGLGLVLGVCALWVLLQMTRVDVVWWWLGVLFAGEAALAVVTGGVCAMQHARMALVVNVVALVNVAVLMGSYLHAHHRTHMGNVNVFAPVCPLMLLQSVSSVVTWRLFVHLQGAFSYDPVQQG